MSAKDWVEFALAVVSGILACVPLVVKLCKSVKEVVKEKNWKLVVNAVPDLMDFAETAFSNGADRKEWVMDSIADVASRAQYDLDDDSKAAISAMIDSICSASKTINKGETWNESF